MLKSIFVFNSFETIVAVLSCLSCRSAFLNPTSVCILLSAPAGGNKEPTHSACCRHCPLCGRPEPHRNTEPGEKPCDLKLWHCLDTLNMTDLSILTDTVQQLSLCIPGARCIKLCIHIDRFMYMHSYCQIYKALHRPVWFFFLMNLNYCEKGNTCKSFISTPTLVH